MSKMNFSKLGLFTSLCILMGTNSFAGIEKSPDTSMNPNIHFDLSVFNGTYELVRNEGDPAKGCLLSYPSSKEEQFNMRYVTNAHDPVGVYHPSIYLEGSDIFHDINQGPSVIDNGFKPVGVMDHLACLAFYSPDGLSRAVEVCGDRKAYMKKNKDLYAKKNISSSKTFTHLGDSGSKTVYQESINEYVPGKAALSETAAKRKLIRAMTLSADGTVLSTFMQEFITVNGERAETSVKHCVFDKVK